MPSETLAETLHCFVSQGRGCAQAPLEGLLTGRTFGVKDLIDVAGEPTGGGCATPRVHNPARSAPVVERLLAAGAVYAGKTHTVQLAFGGWGTNRCTGAPRNPWDAEAFRIAGGSSSGSAVAVASGLVDVALGTDTGGSVRIPASLCGVVGLKTSWGLVSTQGVLPLAPSLDSVGPIARDVGTVAAAFAVVAGRPVVSRDAAPGSLRLRALDVADLTAEDDVLSAYDASLARMDSAGAQVERPPLPVHPGDYVQPTGRILGYEAWALHGDFVRTAAPIDPGVYSRFMAASAIGRDDYLAALARRAQDQSTFARWFEGADILITPTTPRTAAKLDAVDEGDFTLARYTRIANYLDLCGLTLPCGLDRLGLPIGLQLLARAGDEDSLIATGLALERIVLEAPILPPLHVKTVQPGGADIADPRRSPAAMAGPPARRGRAEGPAISNSSSSPFKIADLRITGRPAPSLS